MLTKAYITYKPLIALGQKAEQQVVGFKYFLDHESSY